MRRLRRVNVPKRALGAGAAAGAGGVLAGGGIGLALALAAGVVGIYALERLRKGARDNPRAAEGR